MEILLILPVTFLISDLNAIMQNVTSLPAFPELSAPQIHMADFRQLPDRELKLQISHAQIL
jgi:hypothetical protein